MIELTDIAQHLGYANDNTLEQLPPSYVGPAFRRIDGMLKKYAGTLYNPKSLRIWDFEVTAVRDTVVSPIAVYEQILLVFKRNGQLHISNDYLIKDGEVLCVELNQL